MLRQKPAVKPISWWADHDDGDTLDPLQKERNVKRIVKYMQGKGYCVQQAENQRVKNKTNKKPLIVFINTNQDAITGTSREAYLLPQNQIDGPSELICVFQGCDLFRFFQGQPLQQSTETEAKFWEKPEQITSLYL